MNLLSKVFKHELISGSFYIFIGSMVGNVFAFFVNLFLARNLSYSDYAIFASLLSFITLISIPAGSINTIILRFASGFFVKKETENLNTLYFTFLKLIFLLCIAILALSLIVSSPLKSFLHIDNAWYFFASGLVISAFYLNALNSAFLQSLLKFKFISFISIVAGVIKLIVCVILVTLGFRAFGGLLAIFFMTFAAFLIAFLPLRNILSFKLRDKKLNLQGNEIFSYAFPAFITVFFLTSFTSVDVILAKHFFSASEAGFYSGLSLIGKVIFYFTGPIPMVMFPLLVRRHAMGERFNNLFYLALIIVILPSFAITAFYFVFPNFVINLFLGGREYLKVAPYLGLYGIYITVFSLVNVCANFFLSIKKTNIFYFVGLGAILQFVLIFFFHNSFFQIIGVSLTVSGVLLIVLLALYVKEFVSLDKLGKAIALVNNPRT